jgi:L-serine deaminase
MASESSHVVSYLSAGAAGILAAVAGATTQIVHDPATAQTIHELGLLIAYVTGLAVVIERGLLTWRKFKTAKPETTTPTTTTTEKGATNEAGN